MNGVVGIDQDQDMGDGMQCSDHPYKNNPGGICAFCLQEKLGKLVSSSFPLPIQPSASSSSSPSFRSDIVNGGGAAGPSSAASSLSLHHQALSAAAAAAKARCIGSNYHQGEEYCNTRRARISFLLAKKKKKVSGSASTTGGGAAAPDIVFKRSKSTTTPRRGHHFLDGSEDLSPQKRGGFWSFLYHSSAVKSSVSSSGQKTVDRSNFRDNSNSKISSSSSFVSSAQKDSKCLGSLRNKSEQVCEADEDSSASTNSSQATAASASSFERKVSRSRSVGCGSRSFSGDFFERISTGFGDCTLRRVESQREGKPKASGHRGGDHGGGSHCMKERVKCGGIFSGFMMTSSSSSSSSSSYWVSSSADGPTLNGRTRSWGWAFASPMRAFAAKPPKDGKRDIVRQASDKNATPNLSAIPSLLSVR